MEELLAGYRRFRAARWPAQRETLEALARDGQKPHTLAIACCDSRVAPEMIFDCAPGDVFTVRNIANLVPPYAPDTANHGTSAALEFAVRVLRVRRIAVIGHSSCGGIAALLHEPPPEARDFVANWVRIAEPARKRAVRFADDPVEAARRAEIESVRVSLENLMTFPWIASAHNAGELGVYGFYFDVPSGTLREVTAEGERLITEGAG
ncbi:MULTISPECIES: carbonic anhydrase [Acidiphilium]|jgi:carbonic anhydrase|uniref:carbonic anhydrase n=2 Tax=Acidiphilium TaxID=522 RepID=A5FWA5_ACICJ|nr:MULTISPECIES: carbonic anhydrase [Acidiphilium]MBU6356024.1 carbonic anhydrase [Rhodospirillales bacterium]ABQ29887.1 Carbonate dehydratase [Acidiphilium cryptum JF-5]EGO94396.1 Carbonate dehydratase [Acidiphilium sp. PM]KDM68240.1 carbonic anhydrase IcfA [Acidiphilium sp. JA12-A1]MBS3024837.1 carbonic anhydrase [Acidiphilium multivorum]